MPPNELSFSAPTTVADALDQLSGDASMAIAGGTSLTILMKNGFIDVDQLVYLGRIPELAGVGQRADGAVRLGATATLREVSRSPVVRSALPVLAYAAEQVGNPRVRAVATVGGAVVHGDSRQDLPPVLLALEARVGIAGPSGTREVPMSQFFLGFMETALDEDELVMDVVVPTEATRRAVYCRFTPGSEDDYPTVGIAAALSLGTGGTVARARIGLGGVAPTAILAEDAASMLEGRTPDAALIRRAAAAAAAGSNPSDDQRGSASYKRAMVEVWTRRALERCLAS